MKAIADGSLHSSGYGAPELKLYYQKYMSRSLVLSIALQLACVSALYIVRPPEDRFESKHPAIINLYRPLIPLPFIQTNTLSRVVSGARNFIRSQYALPVPVANPLIDSAAVDPGSQRPGEVFGGDGGGYEGGTGGDFDGISGETETEPPAFRPIEKAPEIAKRVQPLYPANAIRAGIEGTVYLNLWIDKMGRVRKTVVLRSDAQILNSSAEDAAKEWVFTPAIMQHAPVSVWVCIPFRFKLNGR
jgi:TonB family protein